MHGFCFKFEYKIIDLCERKSNSLNFKLSGRYSGKKRSKQISRKRKENPWTSLGVWPDFFLFRNKIFEFWMIENLGSLLQQTGRFSESWIWTVSEWWIWTVSESRIWTYFEAKIRAPIPKEVGGFSWYPEQNIIWILNGENLESLLQQTRRFFGAKFRPIIFKIWMKNRAPFVQGEWSDF